MEPYELNETMERLAGWLREAGIPVSRRLGREVAVNARAKKRLGRCTVRRDGYFDIEVSARLLGQPDELKRTLAHELLHTCPGCANHGLRWKAWAAMAGKLLGCEIRATQPDPEPPAARYVLECADCGRIFTRARRCRLVERPDRYRCRCGGRLVLLDENEVAALKNSGRCARIMNERENRA